MATITLEQLHQDMIGMKKELFHIRTILEEDFEPREEVVQEIERSRKRPKAEFISHEEMRREFQ